ncbi:hypothetical protein [Limnothrix redekei]|uniref:Uncharacterized protein n=1 Tax=Limnothrix redekei LRLZ20PSL1 TaxID=3112953 RepID=A0ABW7CAR0_9CYAN
MNRPSQLLPAAPQTTQTAQVELAPIALDLQPLVTGSNWLGSLLALLVLAHGITTSTERSLRLVMPVVQCLVKWLITQRQKPRR